MLPKQAALRDSLLFSNLQVFCSGLYFSLYMFWSFFRSPCKKPLVAKTLQFDSEPQLDLGLESINRPAVSLPSSLQHLIGQLAETSEEKYRLLEQRDKILRQCKYVFLQA